jgi:hypothetical protein
MCSRQKKNIWELFNLRESAEVRTRWEGCRASASAGGNRGRPTHEDEGAGVGRPALLTNRTATYQPLARSLSPPSFPPSTVPEALGFANARFASSATSGIPNLTQQLVPAPPSAPRPAPPIALRPLCTAAAFAKPPRVLRRVPLPPRAFPG